MGVNNGFSLRAVFFLLLLLCSELAVCDIINPSLLNEYLDNESKSAGGDDDVFS